MKRLLVMGLTALAVVLVWQRPASAWSRLKFGVGLNISWEGSGNSFLFGLLKGDPAPNPNYGGYGGFNGYPPGYAAGANDPNMPPGAPGPYSPGLVPDSFGAQPQAAQAAPAPAPAQPLSAQPVAYFPDQSAAFAQNNVSFGANWLQSGQVPSYWYPGATQVPSYWYGR